ncbi:MAG: hypothetical protein WCP17_01545 [bacterium]
MFPEQIIFITLLINFVGYFFYIKDIFYGQNKPNLVSWFIWMLAPFIGVFFQVKAGVGLSALPVFLAGFGPFIVLMVLMWNKNAYWKISSLDMVCGGLALLSLIFYILTHNLGLSILFAILSDALAFIPTFIKSWKLPDNESGYVYLVGIIGNTLGLLIIKDWSFAIYSFGVYLIIFNFIEVVILYRKKIFKKLFFS